MLLMLSAVLPAALSVIDNVPVRVPLCVGSKVTLMVQLASAARLELQVFVWLKSGDTERHLAIVGRRDRLRDVLAGRAGAGRSVPRLARPI